MIDFNNINSFDAVAYIKKAENQKAREFFQDAIMHAANMSRELYSPMEYQVVQLLVITGQPNILAAIDYVKTLQDASK